MIGSISPLLTGRSWVLFSRIQPPTGTLIKIDATRSLATRVKELDEDSPYEIGVIGVVETADPLEAAKAIQKEHRADRVKGDWFQPTAKLLNFIEAMGQRDLRILVEHMGPAPAGTITVEELARHLRVSVPTIYRYVQAGKLPHFRIAGGRQIRFVLSEVLPFVQQQPSAAAPTR